MANVRFLKDPGFLYDLFFLFVLRFNKEDCLKNCVSRNNKDADVEYYNKLDSELDEISDKLLPFFYLKEDHKCFMTLYYFDDLVSSSLETCEFSVVLEAIKDYNLIVDQMVRFYFPALSDGQVEACKNSFVNVSHEICRSDYSAEVKNGLYSFFLQPEQHLQQLYYSLLEAKQLLAKKYEKEYEAVLDLIQHFDAKRVIEVLATTSNWAIDYSDLDGVAISFCLCVRNCLKLCTADVSLLVLGAAYEARIAELQSQMQRPALDLLGTVLSEQNRIDLLDLIYKKGEVTIHDIEEELGIAGTNAYYHLSMMLRIGMVKTRNRGRTLLYSFNEEYFISVADALLHYIKK
ncbi:MAG: winged helix-turn-helix transcriptional regulator [Ruminococcaceae bacterium]|nr:winged helix-turn-helix transcriptional regulator [Oscillospiraceae bacterium]